MLQKFFQFFQQCHHNIIIKFINLDDKILTNNVKYDSHI